jgi:hypothetical protein
LAWQPGTNLQIETLELGQTITQTRTVIFFFFQFQVIVSIKADEDDRLPFANPSLIQIKKKIKFNRSI